MANTTEDTGFLDESSAERNQGDRQDDLAVDVCISYPDRGVREQHCFTGSKALLETLQSWQRQGLAGILLSWGATPGGAREQVEAQITEAGIAYKTSSPRVPRTDTAAASGSPPPRNGGKSLVASLAALAMVVGIGVRVARLIIGINQGGGKAAQVQADHDRRNQRMIALSFEKAARARAFQELQHPDPKVRVRAVALVGQRYQADKETVPALIGALADRDPNVRRTAVITLGQIEPKSGKVVQAVRDRLADQDESVRLAARDTLEAMK
ncbi:MAG TPA: HEAT repeat domain-containing protein [Gemmataceae bacterium]|jgi:hypothetical protein|nr:HEAT repeat domain-containing protein [Gemmataceae bacterium]